MMMCYMKLIILSYLLLQFRRPKKTEEPETATVAESTEQQPPATETVTTEATPASEPTTETTESKPDEVVETTTAEMSMPEIKSKDSLVHKYLTEEIWNKYKDHKTKTCGFTLKQCVICTLELDNQHCGVYAGDHDSYNDFKDLFDPIVLDYHGLKEGFAHKSDMDPSKLVGATSEDAGIHSTRIRVGRNIEGFGLSPGITQTQRQEMEKLMIKAFESLEGEFAGTYYPLTGMDETTRQKLVDDHFLFMSGDPNLILSGMERDWPEGRGIFHNEAKTFLVWVNEEDQLRIISMEKGGDINGVFKRLSEGLRLIEDSIKKNGDRVFSLDPKLGYITSCPTNLGTGMRASVHIDLPGWGKEGNDKLKARCSELGLQPRGTRGESGGMTGHTYDISNKHRLGYSEVQLVQNMIDGVNKLVEEDKALKTKHGL